MWQVLGKGRLGSMSKIRITKMRGQWHEVDGRWVMPVFHPAYLLRQAADKRLAWRDLLAVRAALDEGGARGASTISQQVVKNVYLWQGRSWLRKALEALITPVNEAIWSKRRVLEVYLNVAEFDEGVFGVQAAAQHYFGVTADKLSATQAARLAAVLPNPKNRSASRPSASLQKRARSIRDGAATIRADGRADCFES